MIRILLFSLILSVNIFAEPIKVSVIIPCAASHLKYLPDLLKDYDNQTCIPDEIVISISQATTDHALFIEKLKRAACSFDLKIYTTSKRLFAGQNRNVAISNCTGDVILSQDADDFPHQQRVEIIKDLYQKHKFDLLLHSYVWSNPKLFDSVEKQKHEFNTHDFTNRRYYCNKIGKNGVQWCFSQKAIWDKTKLIQDLTLFPMVHFGNCAMSSKVARRIKYSSDRSGQDVKFCDAVLKRFSHNILIGLPLICYVNERSLEKERNL